MILRRDALQIVYRVSFFFATSLPSLLSPPYNHTMHVRLSSVLGTPVVDDQTQQFVGLLSDPLIHPDTGKIEGFFVHSAVPDLPSNVFLQTSDIIAWGTNVHVSSIDRLCPPDELVRLQSFFRDPRPFLGQHIRIEDSKRLLGTCSDVQFDTRHCMVEWIFPRRFFIYRQPIPTSDISEVTSDAIWIRDPLRHIREKAIKSSEPEKPTILSTDSVPASA